MANRNGEPYIPPYPICPTRRAGEAFVVVPDDFAFVIKRHVVSDSSPSGRVTEIGGLFELEGHEADTYVATDYIEVPSDSYESMVAWVAQAEDDHGPLQRKAGALFCERIKDCRGVTGNGECWALGKTAMNDVFTQIADEL